MNLGKGKFVFVTGGARSGKSSYAEKLAAEGGNKVLYIATAIPFDDEMKVRIELHKAKRPKEWKTVEAYQALDEVIEKNCNDKTAVMLDCITIMITNLMLDSGLDWQNAKAEQLLNIEKSIGIEIDKFISKANNMASKEGMLFVAVSNEVGMSIVPEYPLSRAFRDIAGRMNQKLAKAADEVYLCVCGIPVKIK